MKLWNAVIASILAIALLMALAGCSGTKIPSSQGNQPPASPEKTQPPTPPSKGGTVNAQQATPADAHTFVYDNIGEQQTLDPVWAFDTASFLPIEQMYEPLTFYKGSSTTDFVPVVASALPTVSTDGLTYTYPIRSEITFHNGDPLTAEDIQYTFLRHLITDRAGGAGFLFLPELLGTAATRDSDGHVKVDLIDLICGGNSKQQAVAVEGNHVIFHLVQPFAPFMQVISGGQSVIVDKKFVIERGGWPGCTGDRPKDIENFKKFNDPPNQSNTALFDVENGSGPYMLQKWDKAGKITTMVAYPKYWQGDPSAKSLKALIFKEVEEFGPRLLDLQNGNADVIDLGAPADLPSVYRTAGARAVVKLPGLVTQSFFFNFDVKQPGGSNPLIGSGKLDGSGIPPDFFRDVHVRRAFNYLFDHALYIQRAYNALAVTPATPNVQGLAFFNAEQPNVSEAGGIRNFVKDNALGKAADEFKQAFGGMIAKPGPVWENGFVFTIRYNSGNMTRQIASNLLQANLQALNDQGQFGKHGSFNVVVQNVPFAQILNQIDDGTLPMFALGWAPDYTDPADYIPQWMGSQAVGAAFSGPGSIDKLPAWGVPPPPTTLSLKKGEATDVPVPASGSVVVISADRAEVDYEAAGATGVVKSNEPMEIRVKPGQAVKVIALGDTDVTLTFKNKTPGGTEYTNWDDLIRQGAATGNPAQRKDIYFTLQQLFVDDAVALMLAQPEIQFIERRWLNGYRYNPADPGNTFPVLYNPAAGITFSKAADGNGSDDTATICVGFPQVVFVLGGTNPSATDCRAKAVSPIPGGQ